MRSLFLVLLFLFACSVSSKLRTSLNIPQCTVIFHDDDYSKTTDDHELKFTPKLNCSNKGTNKMRCFHKQFVPLPWDLQADTSAVSVSSGCDCELTAFGDYNLNHTFTVGGGKKANLKEMNVALKSGDNWYAGIVESEVRFFQVNCWNRILVA